MSSVVAKECGEHPVNWTAIREDLVTYTTLSDPKTRSRRCVGLDPGVWNYCGISAIRILQMQPGLIGSPGSELDGAWSVPVYNWNPCSIGVLAINLFAMIFLTPQERVGLLYHAGAKLDALSMSFHDLLQTQWPIFGLWAHLADVVSVSGAARPTDECHGAGPGSEKSWQLIQQLRLDLGRWVAQRRLVPEGFARRIVAAVDDVISKSEGNHPGCDFALSAAWAALADVAHARGDAAASKASIVRAEACLRAAKTNYTQLDWLSTQWPVFRLLHRMQFALRPSTINGLENAPPSPDLVPRIPEGRPMRFAYNRGFKRSDPLHIDVAGDIVHTDLRRSMPRFFGVEEALPGQQWNLNFVYTSNDYGDLKPAPSLMRMQAASQRLTYVPGAGDIIGEKDAQCGVYTRSVEKWDIRPAMFSEIGGMPPCFMLPEEVSRLRSHIGEQTNLGRAQREAWVRKPEGGWGGRGIEIKYGIEDLVKDPAANETCSYQSLRDVQCLGLHAASNSEASKSPEACNDACCEEDAAPGGSCETWNWREEEGCWVGTPRVCSGPNPLFLGGWQGGHRVRAPAAPRAVVQKYIADPVLYQLEGISPPLRTKTDIRIYGSVVSMDPFRLFVSRYGYFRSGYLEKNYSSATDEDLSDPLMHITHHIPKIESGSYQCPNAPSWDGHKDPETDAGSGGSLHKWFRIAVEQNGLDRKKVWRNIKLVLGLFLLGARRELSCQANPVPHSCGSLGFHFFADLVVDSGGRAWLMEIHPTLALKSHGLGDPEGGWVEVLTRSTRQGSMGTLAAFFTGWMNRPYRQWAELVVRRRLLTHPLWKPDIVLVRLMLARQRETMPGWSGESRTLAGVLAKMLVEEHMACRVTIESVFPLMWRQASHFARARRKGTLDADPFGAGLRSFYRLFEAARRFVQRLARRHAPSGDLRPSRCTAVDFNSDTVWDQPWERASRRFVV